MKLKTTLLLGAALSLPLFALADDVSSINPFAGAFVGAGLGATAATSKLDINGTLSNDSGVFSGTSNRHADAGETAIDGDFFAGYNFALGSNWLLGLQAEFGMNNIKASASANMSVVSSEDPDVIDVVSTSTFKLNNTYGLDADLGYMLSSASELYVGLGWTQGKAKLDMSNVGHYGSDTLFNDSMALNKTINGVKAIVGAQQSLVNNLSVREEMTYTTFDTISHPISEHGSSPFGPVVLTGTGSSKISFLTARLALAYNFSL